MKKVQVNSKSLAKALEKAAKFIDKNSCVQEWQSFLCQCESDKLTVAANTGGTDVFSTSVSCSSDTEFDFLLENYCLPLLKKLEEQTIIITVDNDQKTVISHESGKFEFKGESPRNFGQLLAAPTEEDVNEKNGLPFLHSFMLPAEDICSALKRAVLFVSKDELRPAMTGVFVKVDKNGFVVVSTDAHKLVKGEYEASTDYFCTLPLIEGKEQEQPESTSFILNANICKFLAAYKIEGHILFQVTNKTAFIRLGCNDMVYTAVIDSHFPDYNAVIPKLSNCNKARFTVQKSEFLRSLERISLAMDNKHAVTIKTAGSGKIEANNPDFGISASEILNGENEGENVRIGFNAVFLAEMLKSIPREEVTFNIENVNKACLVTGAEEKNWINLLMPIQLPLEVEKDEEPAPVAQPKPVQEENPLPRMITARRIVVAGKFEWVKGYTDEQGDFIQTDPPAAPKEETPAVLPENNLKELLEMGAIDQATFDELSKIGKGIETKPAPTEPAPLPKQLQEIKDDIEKADIKNKVHFVKPAPLPAAPAKPSTTEFEDEEEEGEDEEETSFETSELDDEYSF